MANWWHAPCPMAPVPRKRGADEGDPQVVATRYELIERIGAGAAALVYRARDRRLDRVVALKLLRDELAADEELGRRFEREARLAAGLDHPNVVRVHDFGRHEGRPFLVMDYVEG